MEVCAFGEGGLDQKEEKGMSTDGLLLLVWVCVD